MNKNKKISGFTLTELAIVVIVIGLILGALLAADEIIEGAKRHSVIKEINKYTNAINTFYTQYNALPGDMSNAEKYWGQDTSGCPGLGDGEGTCDGNGDGYIRGYLTENVRAWQQLTLSEIVIERYTADSSLAYEKNVPEASIGDSFYKLGTAGDLSTNSDDGWTTVNHPIYEQKGAYLGLGGYSDSGGAAMAALKAEAAFTIDKKIDDGNASSGAMVVTRGTNDNGASFREGCIDSASATSYRTAEAGTVNYYTERNIESCRVFYFYSKYD